MWLKEIRSSQVLLVLSSHLSTFLNLSMAKRCLTSEGDLRESEGLLLASLLFVHQRRTPWDWEVYGCVCEPEEY